MVTQTCGRFRKIYSFISFIVEKISCKKIRISCVETLVVYLWRHSPWWSLTQIGSQRDRRMESVEASLVTCFCPLNWSSQICEIMRHMAKNWHPSWGGSSFCPASGNTCVLGQERDFVEYLPPIAFYSWVLVHFHKFTYSAHGCVCLHSAVDLWENEDIHSFIHSYFIS